MKRAAGKVNYVNILVDFRSTSMNILYVIINIIYNFIFMNFKQWWCQLLFEQKNICRATSSHTLTECLHTSFAACLLCCAVVVALVTMIAPLEATPSPILVVVVVPFLGVGTGIATVLPNIIRNFEECFFDKVLLSFTFINNISFTISLY